MPSYFVTKILTLILIIFLNACSFKEDSSQGEIISQIGSKDGQYTALVVRGNGGATVAFDYRIFLRNSDSNLSSSRESLIFLSYAYPVPKKVSFTGRNTIEILCDNGSVFTVSFNERTLKPHRKLRFYKGKPWNTRD